MKRLSFLLVLFAMLQLPLFAASSVQYIGLNVPVEKSSNMPRVRARAMDKSDFKLLYSLLKEEAFENGRIKMIRVACIGNCFTSSQCADMLSLFSFDSNKLQALEYLAPCVVDKRACGVILKVFSFTSNRQKAETLLMGDRRR